MLSMSVLQGWNYRCVSISVCVGEKRDGSTSTVKLAERKGGRAQTSETEVDRKILLMESFKLKRIRPWMWESNSLQSNGIGIEQGK